MKNFKGDISNYMKKLTGTSLVGMSQTRQRIENDYYATPYEATELLLKNFKFNNMGNVLESCVGGGHIAEIIQKYYPDTKITGLDIIDRGYPETIEHDFISYDFKGCKFQNMITNPPFSQAQEFLEKGMKVLDNKGQIAMFLKIQFLEGGKRQELFKKFPPKYIYVFSKRQNPWRNGIDVDENGKPWSNTMCFAWFIWEKDSKTEPIIRWL